MKEILNKTSGYILIVFLLMFSYIYDFQNIITLEPRSVHAWRQTDCLSFTLNYSKEDRGFFEPSMHHIGETGDGKTVSDFPLVYFLIGRLWRITGQHEYLFRGFVMLLFFSALFLVQRTLLSMYKDPFYSIAVPLILFSSPVLVYYSNNFLMNLPAFSLALIGWYFFFQFYQNSRIKYLWLAMAFFTLGGLLKISALLSFFAILGIYAIELTGIYQFRKERRVFPDLKNSLYPFLMLIVLVASWVLFVTRYNSVNNSSYFLVGIMPVWDFTWPEIYKKYHDISTHWLYHNYPGYFQAIIFIFWLVMLMLPRKNNRVFYYLNVVLALGVLSYLLLFYQVIAGHDYYWIDLFILLTIALVSFIFFLKQNLPLLYRWGRVVLLVLLVFNVIYCREKIHERYHGAYMNFYDDYLKDFRASIPYNRSLGIEREDYVISMPEGTINASLYLMDQKGWTTYAKNFESIDFYYDRISRGAKYLFVSDTSLLSQEYLAPFIAEPMGQFKSISIFDLRNVPVPEREAAP
jgi:hypothetical protein